VNVSGSIEHRVVIAIPADVQAQLDRIEAKVDALSPVEVEVSKPALALKIGPVSEQP